MGSSRIFVRSRASGCRFVGRSLLQRGDGAVPKRLVIAGRGLAREPTIINRKRVFDYATAHEPASRSWRRREAASPSMIVAATEFKVASQCPCISVGAPHLDHGVASMFVVIL